MRDLNEHTITSAVLERFAGTPDPRLKAIMASLVTHLHNFVRDVEPTFDEWQHAITYLTRTGQMCSDTRQEFILLSDVLGVSMLVDAINHRMPEGATETTVLGPFHVTDVPFVPNGADIGAGLPGERLFVQGSVSSAGGAPLPGAVLEIWQSDSDGFYDVQRPELEGPTLRTRLRADEQGRFHFWSIMPTPYPIPDDGPVGDLLEATKRHPWRPAHLHFMISAEGHEQLVTHIFVAGGPYLDSDAVFGVKESLIQEFTRQAPGRAPDGTQVDGPWRMLSYDFGLKSLHAPALAMQD
jgi:hydroxyquinol 1,2-dioxygenase